MQTIDMAGRDCTAGGGLAPAGILRGWTLQGYCAVGLQVGRVGQFKL